MNMKKSFWQGDFFESCGSDFYRGRDIRPFYFKGEYNDVHSATIRMANSIRRYAHRRCDHHGCDVRFLPVWLAVTGHSKLAQKTCLPNGFGDDGLIRNFDESCPPRARHQLEGFMATVLRRKPLVSNRTDPSGAYVAALAWGCKHSQKSLEFARGLTEFPQYQFQLVPSWNDLGPWV